MKFIALIRGINVGGNNIIAMSDLKNAVSKCGYKNVSTYIQSGNIIFESDKNEVCVIAEKLEICILNTFKCNTKVVVLTEKMLQAVVKQAPTNWNKEDNTRKYIAFTIPPVEVNEVVKEITMRGGVDSLKTGKNVLYMSTDLNHLTKSGFNKLASKKIYKSLTIRNYNTVSKLLKHTELPE